jgi:hypothetical protein
LKEKCLGENTVISILYYVEYFRHNQAKMKHWYDKDAIIRELKSGEKVIVLLLIHFLPLQAK